MGKYPWSGYFTTSSEPLHKPWWEIRQGRGASRSLDVRISARWVAVLRLRHRARGMMFGSFVREISWSAASDGDEASDNDGIAHRQQVEQPAGALQAREAIASSSRCVIVLPCADTHVPRRATGSKMWRPPSPPVQFFLLYGRRSSDWPGAHSG